VIIKGFTILAECTVYVLRILFPTFRKIRVNSVTSDDGYCIPFIKNFYCSNG